MDPLEEKLKAMPLRSPSSELDERVLNPLRAQSILLSPRRRVIPISWAVAAAILACLLGFGSGLYWGRTPIPPPPQTVQIYVVPVPPGQSNFFDFTQAAQDFPQGKLEFHVSASKGI